MKQQINMELLKQVDEETEERIAKEFPANWEKGDLFEKAYQNYLEQTEKVQKPAVPVRRHILRMISAAASCIVVLGAAYAIRIKPHQLPTVPVETTTETTTQATENTKNTTTAIEKTEPTVPTSPFPTEETNSVTTMITDTVQAILPETEPAALPGSIAVTETPSTEIPTEPVPPETTESVTVTLPTEEASESVQEEQKSTAIDILPGFEVKHQDGRLEITWLEQVSPSPDEFQVYQMDSERFLMQVPESMPEGSSRIYTIWMPGEDTYFNIALIQTKRDIFYQTCKENAVLLPADVNGHPAYYVVESESACTLYWDDGYYTFSMRDTVQNQELMLRIAEALVRADV